MENKKLLKIAVAALATISVLPAGAQAVDLQESAGSLLAAGCGGGKGGCGAQRSISYNNGQQTDAYNYDSRNQNQNQGMTNRSSSAYDSDYNTNRGYTSSAPSTPSYSSSYSSDMTFDSSASGMTLTEADLLRQLNAQGRAIYLSLDRDGRQLALQLASQNTYTDKNQAVKEAQKKVNEMRGSTSGYSGKTNTGR